MPQIIVTAEAPDHTDGALLLRERINLSDLESDSYAGHLLERLGWALIDADDFEHDSKNAQPDSAARSERRMIPLG